jgi:hypothetical protein
MVVAVCPAGLPPLTQQEAIRIADAFAKQERVDLTRFKRPVLHYHKEREGNYWTAYYAPLPIKFPVADGDFSVRVNEASRTASDYPLR